MNSEFWNDIETVLDRVLEANPAGWDRIVKEACGDNEALRNELESLLQRVPDVQHFLNFSPVSSLLIPKEDEFAVDDTPADGIQRIGSYRIIQNIARGGMGQVYLVERDDGVYKQKAALKLLHSSLDHEKMRFRFRTERQILASLRHPNITALLDGGVIRSENPLKNNRPYLVMEYIEGKPIHTWCRENNSGLKARLELFLKAAAAIGHAHKNLVVHCDIKPNNILVTDEGQVKLLDFGIARLLDHTADDGIDAEPMKTLTKRRWFTPEYAAPEQLMQDPVTTAVDIYQLGVLLYELLTGRRPFQKHEHRLPDLEKAILQNEPDKPSTEATNANLRRHLKGDLDSILLKALRKEPDNRYRSVSDFTDDIRRYMEGQSVLARQGKLAYRTKKFIYRHRLVVTAAVILILITGSLIGYYTRQLATERDFADQMAEAARIEAATSAEVSDFMVNLFTSSDPYQRADEEPSVRDLLDRAVERIDELHSSNAILQARLLSALAHSYSSLNLNYEAELLIGRALNLNREAIGDSHEQTALNLRSLGVIIYRQARYEEALLLYIESLDILESLLGMEHPEVANTLTHIGNLKKRTGNLQESREAFEQALTIAESTYGPGHLVTGRILNDFALLLIDMAEYELARDKFRRVISIYENELGADHLMLAETYGNLSHAMGRLGETAGQVENCGRFLEIAEQELGDKHSVVANALICLGNAYRNANRNSDAIPLYNRAVHIYETTLGPEHPFIAFPLANLGNSYRDAGDHQQALDYYKRALSIWDESGSVTMVASILENIGRLYLRLTEPSSARPHLERALQIRGQLHPEGHWRIAAVKVVLGEALIKQNRFEEAEFYLIKAYKILKSTQNQGNRHTRAVLKQLVLLYESMNQPDELEHYQRILADFMQ